MKLPIALRNDFEFEEQHGNTAFTISFRYMPFTKAENRQKMEANDLKDWLTPVYRLQLVATIANEDLYQSFWIMPGQILWFLETIYGENGTIRDFADLATEESKFLERIENAEKAHKEKMLKESQLSLF